MNRKVSAAPDGLDHREVRLVSTGTLPPPPDTSALVQDARRRFCGVNEGSVSQVYPALGRVEPSLFGICIADTGGGLYETGDSRTPFAIMGVAKPFVFALVAQVVGIDRVRHHIGVNATGLPFNSITAIERDPAGRTNPMVNAGAIVTTSLVPAASTDSRWRFIVEGLSAFAGRSLALDEEMLASARTTNHRNRAIAALLHSVGALGSTPAEATELYTRQSCLSVTAVDLAVMGATLADGGVNPVTRERVVCPGVARVTLAAMTVAGMYEMSGDWLVDVGVPGKSGIGGGIVTVSPGKGGLGTYAPPLDDAGNSVKGQLVAAHLARGLGLDILASEPVVL